MTSLSKQLSIYEKRKEDAEKKCKNIAARLRMSHDEDLKDLFVQYKEVVNMSQHLIDTTKTKLRVNKADNEPIQELKSFLGIVIGYINLHIETHGRQKVSEGIPYDTVKERDECDNILKLINEGEYEAAADSLCYLNIVAFRDKFDETAMYYHSTNWVRSKYYYYHILLNRV